MIPLELVVAAFKHEDDADEAMKSLNLAKKGRLLDFKNAAVIRRDQKEKLTIKEPADPGGGKGAAAGGAIGAIIGLIAGPGGVVVGAAAGAFTGGIAASLIDSGIPDEHLKRIGKGLQAGASAIITIVDKQWVGEVEKHLKEAGADVLTGTLKPDIAEHQGKEEGNTA
jgi:uncharacterized membrane protein